MGPEPSPEDLAQRVRGVGRGTAATILSRVADAGATYAFYAVLAWWLSVAGFGRLVLGMTIVQTASSMARFGLDQALLTVPPSGSVNRFAARIVAGLSIGLAALVVIACQAAGHALPPFGLWLTAALPAVAMSQFLIGALRARGDVTTAAIAEGIVQPASAFAFAGVATAFDASLSSFALAWLLSWVMTLAFALRLDWSGGRLAREEASSLLNTGRSMLGVTLFSQAAASADVLLLGAIATAAEVGRYAAAEKIAAAFLLLHAAITSASTPFMRALAEDRALLTSYFRIVTRWSFTAALPLLVVTTGVPALVLRLFGKAYLRDSSTPLVVLSCAAAILLLTGPAGSVLLCSGRARELFRVVGAGTAALVVSVALFARYGAVGAAFGVLAGRIIARGLLALALRRYVTGSIVDGSLLLIISGGAAGIVLTRVSAPWIGAVPAAVLGCIVALGAAFAILVRSGDIAFLQAELRRS